jgi:iron complex outermembrane receptor protein
MTLEQLGQVKVITATKAPQSAWTTPAALAVITDLDLRLAGVTSLPQALRLAPGVDVGQINSQRQAVSIRGFNAEHANKLLVLQDGRSLFTQQFLGVFWDAQDTPLEDVDRIEVVRGPGGTAWGANAVNGVVNVITKDARDTPGAYVSVGGGTLERAFATVRYGGRIGARTHYRVYARSFSRGETQLLSGADAGDDWRQDRVGFRVDSSAADPNRLTLQGDAYTGRLLQYSNRQPGLFRSYGANLLGRLSARLPGDSTLSVVSFLDKVRRNSAPATANSDTLAFEANHQFNLLPAHQINWGASFQHSRNEAIGRIGHNYDPAVRRLRHMSIVVADEMTVVPDRLAFSLGSKAEHNPFTGWEWLPAGRLTWTPNARGTGWAAVSRGVQTPGLSDFDLTIDIPGATRVLSLPNRDRPVGAVLATEVGGRLAASPTLTLDGTIFLNHYDRLGSTTSTFDARTNTLVSRPMNDLFGESMGGELAATWEPRRRWRLRGSYSALGMDLKIRAGGGDVAAVARQEGISPRRQWQLMSMTSLGRDWDATGWLRYTSRRNALGIPAYLGFDLRVAYRPSPDWEVAVVGKDLLDPRHQEFSRSPGFPEASEVPRSGLIEVRWMH